VADFLLPSVLVAEGDNASSGKEQSMNTMKRMGLTLAALAIAGCAHKQQQQTMANETAPEAPVAEAPPPPPPEPTVRPPPPAAAQTSDQDARQAVTEAKRDLATSGDTPEARQKTQEAVGKACATRSQEVKAEADALCKKETKMSGSIVVTHFAVNDATLSTEQKQELEPAVERLKGSDQQVLIEGHTDSTGPDRFNDTLSVERATATRSYLVGEGISPDRIVLKGVGASQPAIENPAAPGENADNRRVVVIIASREP
jgi:outer membrane protein OmpA-like peptidoglycan-associated protein